MIIKRHIYQVFLWIQTYGTSADLFWTFLMTQRCVSKGPSRVYDEYRIKGSIYTYGLSPNCRQELLDYLKTVRMGLWTPGTGRTKSHYQWVGPETSAKTLKEWANPQHMASDVHPDVLWRMLLQLKGMTLSA